MPFKNESKSIFLDILLTIITFGLFNLWVQYRQISDVNNLKGQKSMSFFLMVILTIITFGLYFIWHEFKMTRELHRLRFGIEKPEVEILCAIATFFGLWFVVDSYQQLLLNEIAEGEGQPH